MPGQWQGSMGSMGLMGSQAGLRLGLQRQYSQRPPPLGQSQVLGEAQTRGQTQESVQGQGYSMLPPPPVQGLQRDYAAQSRQYSADWRAGPDRIMSASRRVETEMVEQCDHLHNQSTEGHLQAMPQSVPVLLCHTCSICGRMRSAGFHQHHPVVPGQPLVATPCRRCKRKAKSDHHSSSRDTRIRTCTADEPCEWPTRSSRIDVNYFEHRGRRRIREEVHVTRHLASPSYIIREGSSHARIGLRTLQRERSLLRGSRGDMRGRASSLSPRRPSAYRGVWPPPDVVRMSAGVDTAPPMSDEVWPPPDVLRTHSHSSRKATRNPMRQSSRIIELSPSPPPVRTRSTRLSYRGELQERRPRSPSDDIREYRRSESQVRMASHPRPFRTVMSDRRTFLKESDETFSNTESSRSRLDSPNRGRSKPADTDQETPYRRQSYPHESGQSIREDFGSPRVQFVSKREGRPAQESRGRATYADGEYADGKFDNCVRYRYVERPTSPQTDSKQRADLRQASPPSPRRKTYDDTYAGRRRRASPPGFYEGIRIRQSSISPPSPPSPKRSIYPHYRHIPRLEAMARTRSHTPPEQRRVKSRDYDDLTESGSDHDGSIAEVRSWRGIDESGRPATFAEERKTMRLLEQGSERGGGGEYKALGARLASMSWRDV
jgi:hypothetical protein